MRTVTSKDGTTIAFDKSGQGPALVLVGGTLEYRAMDTDTAKLAAFPLLDQLDGIRQLPMWPMWEAVAPTIAHEMEVVGDDPAVPTQKAARVAVPTLVMAVARSEPWSHTAAKALAKAIPHAEYRAPVLIEFFEGSAEVKPRKSSRRTATAKGK